jgi:hypothetical protein
MRKFDCPLTVLVTAVAQGRSPTAQVGLGRVATVGVGADRGEDMGRLGRAPGSGQVSARSVSAPRPRILQDHLTRFGTVGDGRLFRNPTGGDCAESTIAWVRDKTRKATFTEEEYESSARGNL